MTYIDLTDQLANPREPSAEECNLRLPVDIPDGRSGRACWYPSMSGYVGKAVASANIDGCVDVWVWHDGQFPFGAGRKPARLHHCDPEDFVGFGRFLMSLAS